MLIQLDTDNLTSTEVAVLQALVDAYAPEKSTRRSSKKTESTRAAVLESPVKPEPAEPEQQTPVEPAAEPEQLTLDEGVIPTLEDAVSRATALVSEGKAAAVKAALARVGVSRVSELGKSREIEKFLLELNA